MRLVLCLVVFAACQPDPLNFPRSPGSGGGGGGAGGGGGGGVDGSVDAADLIGQVCLLIDLRRLDQCRTSGADGLTVTLGNESATTLNDGTFTMTTPSGTGLIWHVSGADIVTSVMGVSDVHVIPAITRDDYNALLLANLITLQPGQGSMVVNVVDNGGPVLDATAATTPAAQFVTRYDGASSTTWDLDGVGAFGLAWLVGLTPGLPVFTVSPPNNAQDRSTNIVVEPDSITFAVFDL